MTPSELQAAREAIGWSRAQLAARVGSSGSVIAQMEGGPGQRIVTIDPEVVDYARAVLAAIDAVPRPRLRDRRKRET